MRKSETWEVIQDGMVVASASGRYARTEAFHYALVYAQDGQVIVRKREKRRKRTELERDRGEK